MTWTVSISDFRNDLAEYLVRVQKGDELLIKDDKKDKEIVRVVPIEKFSQKQYAADYRAMLKQVAGTFTAKRHPEWATKKKVEKWLRETRMNAERSFDVPSGF